MKIFERIYDNPINKDGSKKPNKLLGYFNILEGNMDDYSFVAYGKRNDGEIYKIIGTEVSGFYHPNEGGTRIRIEKLRDNDDIKIAKKYGVKIDN